MTYTELKTQIASAMHRSDLAAEIPGFIALAEAMLFREVSVRALEVSTSGVTSGGSIALPSDCGTVGRIVITHDGRETALDYDSSPTQGINGRPSSYQLEAGALRLDSATDGYSYTLLYTPKLIALSDSNASNWLLLNAPDLYLSAAMLEAARWVRDSAAEQAIGSRIPAMLESAKSLVLRCGIPSRGGMQIKPRGFWKCQ